MLVIQQRIKLFKGWSWGTAIDAIARNKVAFKESDSSDTVDVTEKFVFIKLLGPLAGAISNRKLHKKARTLMNDGQDYAKHFMKPHSKGFSLKVTSKISTRKPHDSIFL